MDFLSLAIEVGIKIFGIELNHKYSKEDVNKAIIGLNKVKKQLEIIDNLSVEIIEYLTTPFESEILESDKKYDIIRDRVQGILSRVYASCSGTKIYVVPLTENVLSVIEEPLGSIVRNIHRDNPIEDTVDVVDDIYGIGIHYGLTEPATAPSTGQPSPESPVDSYAPPYKIQRPLHLRRR